MQAALKLTARVLPGKRIEFTAPELTEGEDVELIIVLKAEDAAALEAPSAPIDVIAFIDSLPPGPRSAPTWEEVERNFREERDAWER